MGDVIKQLAVLGSTGSIGQQTLEVVRAFPHKFHIVGLAAGKNTSLLAKQISEFKPRFVYYQDREVQARLANAEYAFLPLEDIARHPRVDTVVIATSGKSGLSPTLAAVKAGKNVALISDGGAPLISDPGRELVERAVEAGITVTPVPGPSAIIAALMASPLAGRFYFVGFLPRSATKAVKEITAILEKDIAVVAFESPERIKKLLAALHKAFGDDVAVTVARELTKVNESFYYGSAQKALDELPAEVKGEITIVIKRVSTFDIGDISVSWPETARALDERGVRSKDIAAALSKVYKVDAKIIYEYLVKRSK